jgi:uncharacterized protein with FMN-binding domain
MKRVVLSIIGTVVGVVALLSFKTHGSSTASGSAGSLPSLALPPPSESSQSPAPASSGPPSAPGSSGAPSASSSAAARRTVVGSSITTRYGIVQARITVVGRRITNVSFAQLTAFDGRSQQINQDAAPTLLQETLSAQDAQIDTVSGATYTSDGYIQSLQSALDQAGLS